MLLQRYFPIGTKRGGSSTGGGGLSVSLSRSDIYKFSSVAGSTATTVTVTATPSGGTAPYTYSWPSSGYISATAPTSATTAFQATGRGIASDDIEMMQCLVTDNVGATCYNTVYVEIQIGGESK